MALQIAVIKEGAEVFLKLQPNLTMTMTDYSSVWDWDAAMKGGYTMKVPIPVAGNEEVFDFVHLPATVGKRYEWTARVYDGGVLEYVGVLSIRASEIGSDKNEIDADFLASALASELVGKKLRDELDEEFEMGETIDDVKDYMDATFLGSWPDFPVSFYPIYAPKFYAENWPDWNGFCNTWKSGGFQLDDPETGSYPPVNEEWRYNCVPQPFVLGLLKSIFSKHGYRMIGDALNDINMKLLTTLNLKALDHVAGQSGTAIITEKQIFGTTPALVSFGDKRDDTFPAGLPMLITPTRPFSEYSGSLYAGLGDVGSRLRLNIGAVSFAGAKLKIYKHDPVTLADTLISDHFITPYTEFVTAYVSNARSIKLEATDGTIEVLPGSTFSSGILNGKANWIKNTFTYADVVPDIDVADFIQAVHQMGVEFLVDDRAKEVEVRMIANTLTSQDVISPEYILNRSKNEIKSKQQGFVSYANESTDLKGKEYGGNDVTFNDLSYLGLIPGMYKYVVNENNYYEYQLGLTFELLGPASSRMRVGTSGDEYSWVIKAQLPLIRTQSNGEQEMLTIYWDGEGNSDFPGLKNESWPLMFVMAGALVGSSSTHPAGRVTGFDYEGGETTEPSHLVINNSSFGWFVKYIEPWLKRMATQETIKVWILKSPGVDSYSLRKKILRVDNNNYRVKEVTRKLGSEEPMEVLAVRVSQE